MDVRIRPLLPLAQWLLPALVVISVLGASFYGWNRPKVQTTSPLMRTEGKTITALGHLTPQGEVIRLSAPSSIDGSRVDRLLVTEGQHIEAGQTVAILSTHAQQQAGVTEAEAAIQVAQKN